MEFAVDSNLMSLIEKKLWHYFDIYAGLPGGRLNRETDLTWIITGFPHKTVNILYGARFSEKGIPDRIDQALRPYRQSDLPVHWWTGPMTQPSYLPQILLDHGLCLSWELTGMFAELSEVSRSADPSVLDIKEVLVFGSMLEFVKVFSQANGYGNEGISMLADLWCNTDIGPDGAWRYFIGYIEREPVATITLRVGEHSVTILHVAVVPHHRKKGIATDITRTALKTVCPDGNRLAILHSTEMACNLYVRMGFKPVCKLTAYTWPGEA